MTKKKVRETKLVDDLKKHFLFIRLSLLDDDHRGRQAFLPVLSYFTLLS